MEEQICTKQHYETEKAKYSGYHSQKTTIPFLISGNPRDSWKNLDVDWDKEGIYRNEDKDAKGELLTTVTGNIEVIAASMRGRSHADVGKPRDDAFHFDFDKETGWNFVAIADGGGSAKYSRKGSELACKTVVETLRKLLTAEYNTKCLNEKSESLRRWKENTSSPDPEDVKTSQLGTVFHSAVHAAWMAINEESERKGAKINDYNTTLLCAAFRYLVELKTWLIVSYWVGDGGAAIIERLAANSSDCNVTVLGKPDSGEFVGQTKFLTMKDEITAESIHKRLRFSFCDSFVAMLFVTDGITDPFFPSDAAVGEGKRWLDFYENILPNGSKAPEAVALKELFDAAKNPQEKADALLNWLNFWSVGNHDDRTILIVKPR
jgi:serine/threonine protein phosphatase PrpC